jgi:endonuclease/exonuclease/phosphatase family metal-dependent hydrolase
MPRRRAIAVQLRVATCNVLHGLDVRTGRVDLAATREAVAALDADVIALQEVDRSLPRSGMADQVAVLAEELGMEGVFCPALLGDPDRSWTVVGPEDPGGPAYGVGLLTRAPLRDVVRTALPGGGDGERQPADGQPSASTPGGPGWDREPRAALTALLDAGGAPLRVTSTHLSYLPWRGAAQLRHAAAVATGEATADAAVPAVLAGDCNLPAAVVRSLLGRRWTHAGGEPTYPAWRPRLQVDQIAVTGGAAVVDVEVQRLPPSDHRAVLATIAVPVAAEEVRRGSPSRP